MARRSRRSRSRRPQARKSKPKTRLVNGQRILIATGQPYTGRAAAETGTEQEQGFEGEAQQQPTGYQGGSIVDYLGSVGQASDYQSRAALARQHGIANYYGSAAQNTQLLNILRGGQTAAPPPAQEPESAGEINRLPNFSMPDDARPSFPDLSGVTSRTDFYRTQTDEMSKAAESYRAQAARAEQSPDAEASQSFLQRLLRSPSPSEVRQEAYEDIGIDPREYFADTRARIAEIDRLNEEYNAVVAAKDQQIAQSFGAQASNNFINNQIAQIERNAAPRLNQMSANINSKAAALEALQGNFAEAQRFVDNAVQDATADLNFNMQLYRTFYDRNQDTINRLDKKYQDAYDTAWRSAENRYESAYQEESDKGKLLLEAAKEGIDLSGYMRGSVNQMRQAFARLSPGSVDSASIGFVDVLQEAIDAGASPEQAAREAADLSEQYGIQVDQRQLSQWVRTARGLNRNVTPPAGEEAPRQGFLDRLFGSFRGFGQGSRSTATSTPRYGSRYTDPYAAFSGASSNSFFSRLFGG